MNVVERDTARAAGSTVAPPEAPAAAAEPARNRRLRPLLSLLPYVARYRARAIAALVALLVAALITLVVPIAVRRMVDFWPAGERQPDRQLLAVMIGIVAVLALSSAARFFLVTTLGEHRRPARGRVRPSRLALVRPFRRGQDRELISAAHRRHHPDQGRGRRLGVGCVATSSCSLSQPP